MIPQKLFIRYVIMLSVSIIFLLTGVRSYAAGYFYIERPRLAAELSFEFEQDNRSVPDRKTKSISKTYSEQLDIETRGWIYHSGLVIYELNFIPEWEQISRKSGKSVTQKTNTFLEGYNAEFIFLRYKPYTLKLSGSRYMTTHNSSFADRSKSEINSYGAALVLKYEILPSSIEYVHSESDRTGFFESSDKTETVRFRTVFTKFGGDTQMEASYLKNNQTSLLSDTRITTKNASLHNLYYLPVSSIANLNSAVAFRELDTDFSNRKVLTWSENLSIRHRRNLSTQYRIRIEDTRTVRSGDINDSLSQSLGFGFGHTLYENLNTTFNISGAKNESTNRAFNLYNAALNWRYTRSIPNGRLNVDIGHDFDVTEVSRANKLAEVTDENVTITDPQGEFLANEHIDSSTIVVTDSNQIPFIKDIDYIISTINFSTRITRIPTGSIPATPNATVLVDYEYQADPPFDYSFLIQSYGGGISLWDIWDINYRFNRSTQYFLGGIKPDSLSRGRSHNVSTELKWRWSNTTFVYTDRKSTEFSLARWSAKETVTIRPGRSVFMSVSGDIGETKFKDMGDTEMFKGLGANIQIRTSRRTNLRLNGFRNEVSGSVLDTVNKGFSAFFEWYYRIYNGNIVYRFAEYDNNKSEETFSNHLIKFVVKREMF